MKEIFARVRSYRPGNLLALFCWLTVLAKLALVANNEILADADDSAVYADQSLRYWTMGFPNGYPIWLRIGRFFGVPQRLAIEMLYLTAVVVLGFAIKKYFGSVAAYLSVGLLALSPTSYYLFDIGFSDGLAMSLTLLALALTLRLFAGGGRLSGNALGLGGILGMLAITRNEDPLLAVWVLSLIVGCALLWRRPNTSIWLLTFWRKPMQAGLIVTAVIVGMVCALCTSYYFADGVFARGVVSIPGHSRLLKNLARIRTGQPQLRFIPISRRARELAYQVSPTFAKYRPLIENPADNWQSVSRAGGLPEGEIGGGWIWHAINMKVLAAANGSPRKAQVEYDKINADVEAAFADGRLRKRFILQPLIGGDMKGLLRAIPPSLSDVIATSFRPEPDKGNVRVFVPELFDRAYMRRAALTSRTSDIFLQGWAFVNQPVNQPLDQAGRKIVKLVVSSDAVDNAGITLGGRPDVVNFFQKQTGLKHDVIGFAGRVKNRLPDSIKVTYILDDGTQLQGEHLRSSLGTTLHSKAGGVEIVENIDVFRLADQPIVDGRVDMESSLYRFALKSRLHVWGSCLVIAAIFFSWYRWALAGDRRWSLYAVFFAFASACWLGRIAIYTLIDARAWPGAQTRYLAPANAVGVVMFCVAIGAFSSLLHSFRTGRMRAQPIEELRHDQVAI